MMDNLILSEAEEAFHHSVAIAVALTADVRIIPYCFSRSGRSGVKGVQSAQNSAILN
jgi:hypothetical protein